MNTSFPPKPSLEQLRKQSKDILKLHKQGDSEGCAVLRSLRQFASASDEDILGAQVALADVQYALAMHYGYDSWVDLKRHVESTAADAHAPILQRSGDKVVIEGFEHLDWGGSAVRRQDSYMTTLAAILRAAGESATFEQVAGVSGGAFRLHVSHPEWCPSAGCTGAGFDCGELAVDAFGVSCETISLDEEENPRGMEMARPAIVASIDDGRPVAYMDGECSLVVGYRDQGQMFICREYAGHKPGYTEMESLRGMLGDAWFIQMFTRTGEKPPWRKSVVKSLETAVMLAKTPAFGDYASGFAAYEAWIDGLENPPAKPNLHGNYYVYAILLTNRAAAAEYLRDIGSLLGSDAATHLTAAAGRYAAVSARLLAGRACVAHPWDESWTPENRAIQAETMRQNLADERVAVEELEQSLAATSDA